MTQEANLKHRMVQQQARRAGIPDGACQRSTPQKAGQRERIPLSQLTDKGTDDDDMGKGVLTCTWVTARPVQDRLEDPDYMEAPGHTNNTGELSAMAYALRRALTRRQTGGRTGGIYTDSLYMYAKNMTTGRWMPKRQHRNSALISNLRRLWRRTQTQMSGEVDIP